ncbi:mycothiol synthase [Solicola gregarius]|uniref:Mycothiol acetyltransferase n=1 Tax=Solicola gregarius TaxID=2908642 RepID=A0AA46TKD8_9ACTN|nr:mycothiol synthase [Solicola gregarius]UYM06916.1 mycothiol synthase [Solicola gregarius]
MSSSDISVADHLEPDDIADVDRLVGRATTADGVAPLNEQSLLRLHDPEARGVRHVRATSGAELIGYAIGELGPGDEPLTVECVVASDHRRRGVGGQLVAAMIAEAGGRRTLAWAHGDLPGSAELATSSGFERIRILLRMEATLDGSFEAPTAPDGVVFRTYRPGRDDAAWLALNARAFANHPEQGSMTQRDLDQRVASDWFDSDGFFLAERDGELIGFHWTKVADGVGEVYVVGVDPDAQGLGLGSALTRLGLVHLQGRGLRTVDLYVEGDNEPALAVYRRLGFAEAARDVMYARG